MGKQWAATLVVGVLLVGACGTSRSDSRGQTPSHPGVAPTTPTTRRAPTTTGPTVPAYSFDNSVPPPKLVNTGTNYVAILKSLEEYGNWAAAHRPDPAQVGAFVAPGTRLSSLYARDLQHLRDNNRRGIETLRAPSTYEILSANADAFSVRVVETIATHRIVDPSGRTTSEVRFPAPRTYNDLVVRIKTRWYLAALDVVDSNSSPS